MLGSFELTGIEYVESSESRALVEHRVPGLAGNYLQDLGSVPNRIVIAGTRHGDEARDAFLTGIRELFNAGEPTTFVADINTATDITDVVVEDVQVTELMEGQGDLVLTGHAHGGQIRTPLGAVFTRTRARFPDVRGLQRVNGRWAHMSTGLGATVPLRFLCPPEIAILHLVPEPPASSSRKAKPMAAVTTTSASAVRLRAFMVWSRALPNA